MSDRWINQFLGSYKGVAIRAKKQDRVLLVNSADIFKANGSRSKFRFDKWRGEEEAQEFLKNKVEKLEIEPLKNKKGVIVEIPGVIERFIGDRNFQGTYISKEIAELYAKSISEECFEWFEKLFTEEETTEAVKAKKITIELGNIKIDVYEIPNGEYRLSQIQIAKIVNAGETSFRDFLTSKSPEALPYKDSRFVKIKTEGNNAQPKGIPIPVAAAYWTKESIKGNKKASRLLGACAVESIEHRANKAFGKEVTEEERNQRWEKTYKSIIADLPSPLANNKNSHVRIAVFEGDGRKIKQMYPQGIIPGFTSKNRIIERLITLSSYAESSPWKLTLGQELFSIKSSRRAKCPDFISQVVNINNKQVVFVFQIVENIVTINDLDDCVNRKYTYLAKEQYDVDYSFLFLVSPLGMNKGARNVLEEEIELGENQAYREVGIITIKDLASFYYRLALEGKKNNKNINKINNYFAPFLNYQTKVSLNKTTQLSIPFPSVS